MPAPLLRGGSAAAETPFNASVPAFIRRYSSSTWRRPSTRHNPRSASAARPYLRRCAPAQKTVVLFRRRYNARARCRLSDATSGMGTDTPARGPSWRGMGAGFYGPAWRTIVQQMPRYGWTCGEASEPTHCATSVGLAPGACASSTGSPASQTTLRAGGARRHAATRKPRKAHPPSTTAQQQPATMPLRMPDAQAASSPPEEASSVRQLSTPSTERWNMEIDIIGPARRQTARRAEARYTQRGQQCAKTSAAVCRCQGDGAANAAHSIVRNSPTRKETGFVRRQTGQPPRQTRTRLTTSACFCARPAVGKSAPQRRQASPACAEMHGSTAPCGTGCAPA